MNISYEKQVITQYRTEVNIAGTCLSFMFNQEPTLDHIVDFIVNKVTAIDIDRGVGMYGGDLLVYKDSTHASGYLSFWFSIHKDKIIESLCYTEGNLAREKVRDILTRLAKTQESDYETKRTSKPLLQSLPSKTILC